MRLLPVCLMASCAAAAELPNVVFVEPAGKINTASAEIRESMPLYRRVSDASKYEPWLNNESAQRALRLYAQTARIAAPGASVPDYYVALVRGGNHAAVGFRLETSEGVKEYPRTAYILLEPAPEWFETTMYHETGHVAMDMLAGGRRLDGREVASISHSTAALSDRTTRSAKVGPFIWRPWRRIWRTAKACAGATSTTPSDSATRPIARTSITAAPPI